MKLRILIIILTWTSISAFWLWLTGCGECSKVAYADTEKSPRIKFREQIHDFGTVDEKQNSEYVFKFKNVGEGKLLVKKVVSSCGCTATLVSRKIILPGESGEVKVSLRLRGYIGKIEKSIRVYTNDPDKPVTKLHVNALIKSKLTMIPENLVFRRAGKHKAMSRIVTILSIDNTNLKVKKLETSSRFVEAELVPAEKRYSNSVAIKITLVQGAPVGSIDEEVTIYTNHREMPIVKLPISGEILGEVAVIPRIAFLGMVKVGQKALRKVILLNSSGEDLEILEIKSDLDFVRAEVTPIIQGKKYEITISLTKNTPVGSVRGKLLVRTNIPEYAKIEVPIYALIRKL